MSAGTMEFDVRYSLCRIRHEKKLSQDVLASQIGVTRQAFNNWEGGVNAPTAMNLFKWADALGVELKVSA